MSTSEKVAHLIDKSSRKLRILYCINRFPSVSETFIVNQIVEMIKHGHHIAIYALIKQDIDVVHDGIRQYGLLNSTTFAPRVPSSLVGRAKKVFRLFGSYAHDRAIMRCISSFRIFGLMRIVPFRRFIHCRNLAQEMEEFEPDIIHAHFGTNAILPMCAQKAGACPSAKMLVSFHGFDLCNTLNNRYYDLFRHAQCFTVNSNYTYKIAESIGCPTEKLVKLPMGVDCNQFMPRPHHGYDKKTDVIKILYVGRLVEIKGVDLAIRSIARLSSLTDKKIRFVVVGDGDMRNEAEKLVKDFNLQSIVEFRGSLSQKETIECFANSDIFLFPGVTAKDGRQEAQGLVIQEAQAMELPVVVSDAGGVPEGLIDGESGFVIPERDVDAIAKALKYLLENPEKRASMGRKGREFVRERFDLSVLGGRLEKLYYETLECG
jgi:colanic acid/amylovoran biosynthesis glycosyltransferase